MPGPATPSSSEADPLGFVTWADDRPTGGNRYNQALIRAVRRAGQPIRVQQVAGPWPAATGRGRQALSAALRAAPACIVDGIVASTCPDQIREAAAAGHRVAVLLHMPVTDEVGLPERTRLAYQRLEAAAVSAATAVLSPSRWAAEELRRRYGRDDVVVAPPGVDRAPVATGSRPPHLLVLGALTPTKDQLGVLDAWAELSDLEWTAAVVGALDAAPDYANRVRAAARAFGGRVEVPGVRIGAALEREWSATDLLVHHSRSETYGLVVSEALAHGIPAIVRAGTGAAEALGAAEEGPLPGRVIPPAELASALRAWLTSARLRGEWRQAALHRRETLPSWDSTAATVLEVLAR